MQLLLTSSSLGRALEQQTHLHVKLTLRMRKSIERARGECQKTLRELELARKGTRLLTGRFNPICPSWQYFIDGSNARRGPRDGTA